MHDPDACFQSAVALTAAVARGERSCEAVVGSFCSRIEVIDPKVNALCTFVPEQALETARQADARLAAGGPARALEGLPIAVKDLTDTAGIRTTHGSPLFADHVPELDQLFVTRLREAGAILVGKTNTPEFGAGSQTFNTLFGATRNPFALDRTAGGSSGGAAAALAARMLPIADGSDLGGSLRNPAAFCNVIGFRPTPGRVARWPAADPWSPLAVNGPMARSVEDLALLLSVMAGPDPRDPLARPESGANFRPPIPPLRGRPRIACTPDLGFLPVAREIREVFVAGVAALAPLGEVTDGPLPDLRDAPEAFQVLRALSFVGRFGEIHARTPSAFKDTIIWNIERGLALTPREIAAAQTVHGEIRVRMLAFFAERDFLVLPATQVAPFPVEQEWVRSIENVEMHSYLDWMQICSVITMTGCPAISMPCGFTEGGLPVGLQIVGRPGADLDVLRMARAFELATGFAERVPEL